MKKNLLLLATAITFSTATFAQTATNSTNLSNCKNVCDKKRIVESGPFLGIRFNLIPNTNTVQIIEVLPNTSAQKNGFAPNDVITKFENTAIQNNQHLIAMVAKHQPGDLVWISYTHAGKNLEKQVAIGAQFTKEVIEKICCDEPKALGVTMKVSVSPNPASSNITLQSDGKIEGDVSIKIMDMNGSVTKSFNTNNTGQLNVSLDISSLVNGQYFVKVQTKENQFIEKLIVVGN
jgi:PDZ domain/Secretion system C-terminal sorting domain